MKQVFEFEIGEPKQKIGFKFGMMALGITEEKEGRSLKDILVSLSEGKITTSLLLNILYGAAVQYCDHKGLEEPTLSQVSDWCEEIGIDKIQPVVVEAFRMYVPKNSTALAEAGAQ